LVQRSELGGAITPPSYVPGNGDRDCR